MSSNSKDSLIASILERRIEHVFPDRQSVEARLYSSEPLTFYYGIDPTGPTIHIGHLVPLLLLKSLAQLGHKIILLIGDFTARIGDPTDKTSARTALTEAEVVANMAHYLEQLDHIMPRDSYELRYNSTWLATMSFEDVLKLASNVTVQQMLTRDMFQERIKEAKPIYIHEFLYPLMQGYDSVAMEIDGEVGGNDQTFNMLVGRDLEKILLNKDKIVLASRLLVNSTSGKKMSKTEGAIIGISDSPQDIFGKTMASIPDAMIRTVFELCTEVEQATINEWEQSFTNPRDFKQALAHELVRMFYDAAQADKTQAEFNEVFAKGKLPETMPEFKLTSAEVDLIDVLVDSTMTASRAEAKRLVQQGGISVNDNVVETWEIKLKSGDTLRIGSHRFLKII